MEESSALLWFRADGPGRMRVNSGEWVEAVADRDFTHVFKLPLGRYRSGTDTGSIPLPPLYLYPVLW